METLWFVAEFVFYILLAYGALGLIGFLALRHRDPDEES